MDDMGVDVSVLVPLPWLELDPELHANEGDAIKACRVANDEMAKVVRAYPDRFVGTALVPTISSSAMVEETKRALSPECGLRGVSLFCGPTVKPLDHPSFEPLYALCESMGAPIWVHPCRPQSFADYMAYAPGEDGAQGPGSMYQIWNTFGWVYDTSVSMVHVALGGVFRRYPELKMVAHHVGGMVPFFAVRFETQMRNFADQSRLHLLEDLTNFYVDTATFGEDSAALDIALKFFKPGRVCFGTDSPMDMGRRGLFTKAAMASLEGMKSLPDDPLERENMLKELFAGNAEQLLSGTTSSAAGSRAAFASSSM